MNEDRTESFESPLEAVLSDTPQDDPPTDLKQRCLQAVRPADSGQAPVASLWPIVWKSAAGLAAAFIVMVAVITVMPSKKADRGSGRVARLTASPQQQPESLGADLKAGPESDSTAGISRGGAFTETEGLAAPVVALRQRLEETSAGDSAAPRGASPPAVSDEVWAGTRYVDAGTAVEGRDGARAKRAPASQPAAAPGEPEGYDYYSVYGGAEDSLARPWRDESGERQKITHKEMKVAVDAIEDAHERAASIITRAKGYVDTEELRVNERGEGEAVLNARVPIDAFDGVISQLRELGKVLELRGESEDRTQEYYSRGQSIRELAEKEVALVAKYEQERNRSRRQQLYYQIQTIRRQIKEQKAPLKGLSDETHFAYLTVTLTQAEGPRQFLHRISGSIPTAGAWVAISAIFWVPLLLVVMVVWRRLASRGH